MPNNLEDLFVSYKSVRTGATNTPYRYSPQPTSEELIGPEQRTRAQQVLRTQRSPGDIPEDDAITQVWESEMESQPREFQWFTTQLRTAWKDNVAPSEYQSPALPTPYRQLTGPVTPYSRGALAKEIQELFAKAGINATVTSGKRAAGQAGNAGKKSHHVNGNAVDIIPGEGETFDTLRTKMMGNHDILEFFYSNGLGIIDETDPEVRKRTGATGAHYHIGPDQWAVKTWEQWLSDSDDLIDRPSTNPTGNAQQDWARMIYNQYYDRLKKEYGNQYTNDHYRKIALYMTQQSAIESGYGEKTRGYNYGGHKKDGKLIEYNSLDDFLDAHMNTLKKWNFMKARSLRDYIDSFYEEGRQRYNAHQDADTYYSSVYGTTDRMKRYLGLRAKMGGKFANIRQLYEKSFS